MQQKPAMRSRSKVAPLSEVRQYLGMSQGEFADYLQVKRGHLSMAELGKRELAPEIRDRVTQLFNIIRDSAKRPGKLLEKKESKIKSQLIEDAKFRVSRNDRKLEKAEKALSNLQYEHTWATGYLANLDTLRENASPHLLPLFEVQQIKAEKLLEKAGEDARFNLERHIASIKAETAFFKKKLKDWNDE